MLRFSFTLLLLATTIASALVLAFSRERPEVPQFVGVEECRSCHSSRSSGNQFEEWRESPHSRAFAPLESDSAREYLAQQGDSPAECVGCHTTTGKVATDSIHRALNREGVGCERCHGPGSLYAGDMIMRNRELFRDRGGAAGTLQDCFSCHRPLSRGIERLPCPFDHDSLQAEAAWEAIGHSRNDTNESGLD